MGSPKETATVLEDMKINVKVKISSLWVAVMLCYIYGDFFGLFKPGTLKGMLEGEMAVLGQVTQGVLLGVSVLMAIPSVMIFLSLVLKPKVNRYTNIILGAIYTIIMLITMPGAWDFYIFWGVIEIVFTVLIIWYAWNWPKQNIKG